MKFKTKTETFTEPVTIDGKTHTIERTREFRVPDAPPDWDELRSRAGALGTGLVVVGALAWSVVSIGSLLSALAPTWLAYTIAAVFDLAWILAMNTEHELRFEPAKQRVPKRFGWALLGVSVAVIFVHGLQVADVVVAVAGSVIAILAKLLWNMRVWATTRELGETTRGWLNAELDEAHAALAITTQRRKIARVRARAGAELRALGAEPGYPVDIQVDRADVHPEPAPDAVIAPPPVGGVSAPDTRPSRPDIHRISTQEEGVSALAALIKAGNTPTIAEVQEMFGKPYTTAQRWLTKAKAQADANTGQYL